jgi:hypothetical protein
MNKTREVKKAHITLKGCDLISVENTSKQTVPYINNTVWKIILINTTRSISINNFKKIDQLNSKPMYFQSIQVEHK